MLQGVLVQTHCSWNTKLTVGYHVNREDAGFMRTTERDSISALVDPGHHRCLRPQEGHGAWLEHEYLKCP